MFLWYEGTRTIGYYDRQLPRGASAAGSRKGTEGNQSTSLADAKYSTLNPKSALQYIIRLIGAIE